MHNQTIKMKTKQVYLFGTCLIDVYYPQAGMDAIKLLELAGYEVVFPQAQTCCGQPAYNSGFQDLSLDVIRHTINTFSQHKLPLIVPSASCAGMIKHHYQHALPSDGIDAKSAAELAERTFELIDFLLDKLPYHRLKKHPSMRVCLHQSCSAQREMKVAASWEKILARMPYIEVLTPQYANECCGFGGTFAVKSPDVSAVMTEDKCQAILNTQAKYVVSGDCGCLMNLSGHLEHRIEHQLKHQKEPVTPMHLASFIAQQFELSDEH